MRPLEETLAEFMIQVVIWTFDEQWWKHQNAAKPKEQHILRQWWAAWGAFTRQSASNTIPSESGVRFSGAPSGPALELVAFGYDLYCLQVEDRLPGFVTERLRQKKSFQAASYEIAVAAILTRAGFDIEFLDPNGQAGTHCEFLASHPELASPIAVEAKSRVRPGSYGEPGTFTFDADVSGIFNLVSKASKQGFAFSASPLLIFVDVNVPPTPDLPPEAKPWIRDMNLVFDKMLGAESEHEATPWSAIVATNFGLHLAGEDVPAPPVEVGMAWSARARHAIPERYRAAIVQQVVEYGKIPNEI
jgi:hypothetical protein